MTKRNIALIGARGAGKSKLARRYSKLSGKLAFSTDTLVCYEAGGLTIEKIVARDGWPAFRSQEYEILKKITPMSGTIIDCGGGIFFEAADPSTGIEPLSLRKLELIQESSYIIYLKRSIDYLLHKIVPGDHNRPDLKGSYKEILKYRLPIYEKYSNFTLDMDKLDIPAAAKLLSEKLGD
jgi:shikimate kinase